MNNVLTYLDWRGDISFDYSPFNEIDSVIISRLAYIPFDDIITSSFTHGISLGRAAEKFFGKIEAMKKVDKNHDLALLKKAAQSKRFTDLTICGYVSEWDEDSEKQFSAMTISLPDNSWYIAYRGTDNSLVGWKEDFNMSFKCPVPSQESAVSYIRKAASHLTGNLVVGGHSKGGNLAVFASAFSGAETQKRICGIYNFDGPGFDSSVIGTPEYKNIAELVLTFVPQSSIIGMLLEHEEPYAIIKSAGKTGMLQHNIYSWSVNRNSFKKLENVDTRSTFVDFTLKDWIKKMSPEEREAFIESTYRMLTQSGIHTMSDISSNGLVRLINFVSSLKYLDDESRKSVIKALELLVESASKGLKEVVL